MGYIILIQSNCREQLKMWAPSVLLWIEAYVCRCGYVCVCVYLKYLLKSKEAVVPLHTPTKSEVYHGDQQERVEQRVY